MHSRAHHHRFQPFPQYLYHSMWIDKGRLLDEPWFHVALVAAMLAIACLVIVIRNLV